MVQITEHPTSELDLKPEIAEFNIQPLGQVFDSLVVVGHGYGGRKRRESVMDAESKDFKINLKPFYLKNLTSIYEEQSQFLKLEVMDKHTGQTNALFLRGDHDKQPQKYNWKLVDKPLSDQPATADSQDLAKQVLTPLIEGFQSYTDEAKMTYLSDLEIVQKSVTEKARKNGPHIGHLLGRH